MESLNDVEKSEITNLLKDYKHLSVREESARMMLKNIGYDHVPVLLDPTFMLKMEDWASLASKRIIPEKYLFVYMPYNATDEEAHYNIIRKIAKERNLIVVSFSLTYLKDKRADKTIFYPSPGDFVSLILHADFIVTNSFHGTAFSINLNKQFVPIKPLRFSNRVENILSMIGLSSKLIRGKNFNELNEDVMACIDYTKVNSILDSKRQIAIDYLIASLK